MLCGRCTACEESSGIIAAAVGTGPPPPNVLGRPAETRVRTLQVNSSAEPSWIVASLIPIILRHGLITGRHPRRQQACRGRAAHERQLARCRAGGGRGLGAAVRPLAWTCSAALQGPSPPPPFAPAASPAWRVAPSGAYTCAHRHAPAAVPATSASGTSSTVPSPSTDRTCSTTLVQWHSSPQEWPVSCMGSCSTKMQKRPRQSGQSIRLRQSGQSIRRRPESKWHRVSCGGAVFMRVFIYHALQGVSGWGVP